MKKDPFKEPIYLRYSLVGGLNNQTRSMESALPFESNKFSIPAMGGSDNYNFRAGKYA